MANGCKCCRRFCGLFKPRSIEPEPFPGAAPRASISGAVEVRNSLSSQLTALAPSEHSAHAEVVPERPEANWRVWSFVTALSPRGLCQRRRQGDARECPVTERLKHPEPSGSTFTTAERSRSLDEEAPVGWSYTVQGVEICLRSESDVARSVELMLLYEDCLSGAEASNGQSLIQVNLLAAVLDKFHPLVSKLTPKSELPTNILKLLDGASPEAHGDGAIHDVCQLPKREEGPRSGMQWAFFEFEFAVICISTMLRDIKESGGIEDGDDKASFLRKVQDMERSGALRAGHVNTVAQQTYANTLGLHQKRCLSDVVARSLRGVITTAMSLKLRWTSMSKFIGNFDFETAKEWRLFLCFATKICKRLRENDQALSGCPFGSIPEEESIVATYEESYTLLGSVAAGSEQCIWWHNI